MRYEHSPLDIRNIVHVTTERPWPHGPLILAPRHKGLCVDQCTEHTSPVPHACSFDFSQDSIVTLVSTVHACGSVLCTPHDSTLAFSFTNKEGFSPSISLKRVCLLTCVTWPVRWQPAMLTQSSKELVVACDSTSPCISFKVAHGSQKAFSCHFRLHGCAQASSSSSPWDVRLGRSMHPFGSMKMPLAMPRRKVCFTVASAP